MNKTKVTIEVGGIRYKRNAEIGHTNTDDTHKYIQRVNNNTCMHKQTHVRIHQERESENEN